MRVIDANGMILGRLAAKAAKLALLGEQVAVVNCENAVVSGKQSVILARWKEKFRRTTPDKGPIYSTMPDRIIRRTIRGMLPKTHWSEGSRGRQAYSRVMCYLGVPRELANEKLEVIDGLSAGNLKSPYRMTLKQISALIRGKKL